MTGINRQILLVSRPDGAARLDNFRLVEGPMCAPAEGEVLVEQQFLSLDPYMRGRMNEAKSYAAPQPLDAVMQGGSAGRVIASAHPNFMIGDTVVGMGGWQTHALVDANRPGALRKVDATRIPLSAYLGAVGMPGVTAWYGLNVLCAPKAGETVVVSAASGAVGSVVGQLAKRLGCRVVGIAGGPEKCSYVADVLGFDACVDHKAHQDVDALERAILAAAPAGVDCNFENVGGTVLDAVLRCMNPFGRVALCGMISRYDGSGAPLSEPALLLTQRLRLQGFIVSEHPDIWPDALSALAALVANGQLHYRESVAHGLEAAPAAFLGMLRGQNFGKQLVKLT